MDVASMIPYTCVYLDCCWRDVLYALKESSVGIQNRKNIVTDINSIWTTPENPNHVFPCLSVRTGLDLFLRVKNFPPGSEVIMSALNIPDMERIVKHHKLKVVPLDISLETTGPKLEVFENLITSKTVCLILAHVYGKWVSVDPFIDLAKKNNIYVLEDCAEGFYGFNNIGNPRCDINLFSFGSIKYYSAFGGAILKIKDTDLRDKMEQLYKTDPVQPRGMYLKKVLKMSFIYCLLNIPSVMRYGLVIPKLIGIDHKKVLVSWLRGFPNDFFRLIRYQPSTPLLSVLLHRFKNLDKKDIELSRMKGDYVSDRLPEKVLQVGSSADIKNYWLFPIIVDYPDEVVKTLNALGVDAYRGATQLSIIEPENGNNNHNMNGMKHLDKFVTSYPHEAKYLIDHVVYLPVTKNVPFHYLDRICEAVVLAIYQTQTSRLPKLNLKSKL